MSFGAYPAVTITAALEAHEAARKVLVNGQDPMVQKAMAQEEIKIAQAAASVPHPFRNMAMGWFDW
jgi:hypothetical protein